MPKGYAIPDDVKRNALTEYYSGIGTVDQICVRHGIAKRTMYDWIEQKGHGARVHNAKEPRKGVRLSTEEVEIILYMIQQCEPKMSKQRKAIVLPLEQRLLDIADMLCEMKGQ